MNRIFLLLLGVCLFACSNSESVYSQHDSDPILVADSLDGMLSVRLEQKNLHLGTNEVAAKANERPQMNVLLNYDFSIAKHEVTCREFNDLMKSTLVTLDCEIANLPATNLTYYDAVLFANARSKAEGFDTAYTYTAAVLDDEKHCSNLEGFAFHPEKEGYRLPTEAEWTYVANLNWRPDSAWTADNSCFKLHEVCHFASADVDVCDMAGNAMEWVNDWLGGFRDTTVSNYVGAPDGGSLGQRVVKGGSYRNEAHSIALYARGDVYTVTSSTRADYVGFRLAFGAIPNATWMNSNGDAMTSRIVPLANSSSIRSRTGTFRSKLVFRNDLTGNLAFIDYSNSILSVVEIADTIDAYHPEISPDGKKVAFCTGLEGISGKSDLYVRDLNGMGSNLVKLDVESAAIPRWRVLENGDTAIVYVTGAGNNKNESSFEESSTWLVKFANGKFGKPEKLFDGAYHGGISEDGSLAVTGARLLRARISNHDTVWYNEEQACNVSLAKDSSKRTLFLDFGGKTGRDYVGEDYATHQRLLIADSLGKLMGSVAAPTGYTFDHSEWTFGGNNLAVATLTNSAGAHTKIVLVNVADGEVMDLAEGDELWHPSFWSLQNSMLENVTLDVDSAGVYLDEDFDVGATILRYKIELVWTYRDWANVVVLGSSRPQSGIIPAKMRDQFKTLNVTNVPNMVASTEFIAKNYVFPHVKNLKYLVVSLDIDLWHKDEQSEYNFFYKDYRKYPGYVYDENHDFWKNGYPEGLAELTQNTLGQEYNENLLRSTLGYVPGNPANWEEKPAVEFDSTWMDYWPDHFEASFEHLQNILKMAENYNVKVIGIVFPQSPNFKKTGAFGRYGVRRSEAPALLKRIQNLESVYPNFIFWDENKMGDHDYDDSMANNKDHLSDLGAQQLTERLNLLLEGLE